jgi:hypothetical protein
MPPEILLTRPHFMNRRIYPALKILNQKYPTQFCEAFQRMSFERCSVHFTELLIIRSQVPRRGQKPSLSAFCLTADLPGCRGLQSGQVTS